MSVYTNNVRHKICRLSRRWVFALLLFGLTWSVQAKEPLSSLEIQAGYIYRFIFFTEWPSHKESPDGAIMIGVYGNPRMVEALQPITGKTINGRQVQLKRLDDENLQVSAGKCHVLFISRTSAAKTKLILTLVAGQAVLTIGDAKSFIDMGGVIGFVPDKDALRFEVNRVAAIHAQLVLRSRLLRLAKSVLQK